MTTRWLALLVALTLAGVACGPKPDEGASAPPTTAPTDATGGGEVVARYAGRTLTTGRVLAEMERLPAPSRAYLQAPERKKQFVENLILNDLLFEEGREDGLDKDPDIQRQVDELRRRLVVQRVMRDYQKAPEISDDDAKRYYDENPTLYSTTQIRASHILVKDESQAREIHAAVKADPTKFPELAKEKSVDKTSAQRGGDLGMFGQGRMVPEFERAAFVLEPGQVSDVVKTQYGFHVILVAERKEGERRPFDQVKEQIKATLRNKALQERTEAHYAKLKSDAKVEVMDGVLDTLTVPTGPTAGAPARTGH